MHVDWGIFKEEVNEKIKYWVDVWSEISVDIEAGVLGSSIITPHVLISDIQNEITFNLLKNKDNKNYFLDRIKLIIKKDKIIKANYLSEFTLLLDNLERSNTSYLKTIIKNIKRELSTENYVQYVFTELENILLSDKVTDAIYIEIKDLSLTLISELITSGNSISKIKDMASNTFAFYDEFPDLIITKFENHRLERQKYSNDKNFFKDLKEYIDKLTIEERIQSFESYLIKEPQEINYIFPVIGISHMHGNFVMNGIEFYNPLYTSRIDFNINDTNRLEMFNMDYEYEHITNVLVKVKAIDIEIGKQKAFEKAKVCLDLLKFLYQADRQVKIDNNNYIVTNLESKVLETEVVPPSYGPIRSENENIGIEHIPMNIERIIKNEHSLKLIRNVESVLCLMDDNNLRRTVVNSLSWYQKARIANKVEEKLLNYWITIENLMEFKSNSTNENILSDKNTNENKYVLAKKILSQITVLHYIKDLLYDLYRDLKLKAGFIFPEMPATLRQECNFHIMEGTIDLFSFKNCLPELIKYTTKKFYIDKINFVYNFYENNEFALKEIRQKVKEIENDILYIYKYRNQIVHNGHVDQNILPHVVQNARTYATYLIGEVITQCNGTEKDLIDIMVNINYEYNVLIKNLGDKNKSGVNLLKF